MKYLIVFVIFCAATILYLIMPSSSDQVIITFPKERFVSIKNGKFSLNGKEFYPITLNYIVSLQTDEKNFWPSPYKAYNKNSKFKYHTKDSCLLQLKADMNLIKELGFNSVRLVGIGEQKIENKITGIISIAAITGEGKNTSLILASNENYKKYIDALKELFNIVNQAGLKSIFLIPITHPEIKTTEEHLIKIATRFNIDTSILAYDLFNEPLYFDSLERIKKEVYEIVNNWNKIMKKNAPNQLITIGLVGIREVFKWDPNILNVDFVSLHPYEVGTEQVQNEIYWYGKYIKKPWIIGETGLPADNDSVKYDIQKKFARKTLERTYNCGGIGYSWWQYKDVEWFNFHANFLGILNRSGEITNLKGCKIFGSLKPVAEEFKIYKLNKTGDCNCLDNYYNYFSFKTCRLIGYLKDEENIPIEGGVILAWNQWWSNSYHTISKSDGNFELLGDFPFYHWMASASMYSMIRSDIDPKKAKLGKDNIPTIDIGTLKLKRLTFIKE